MFNNLVESELHTHEHVRRSWFFLGTMATYALLFMILGVVSIYAYDAHLDEQTNEYIVTFVPPVQAAETTVRPSAPRAASSTDNVRRIPERAEAIARINESTKPPDKISSDPLKGRELPAFGAVAITGRDVDVGSGGVTGSATGHNIPTGGTSRSVKVEIEETPPPPQVAPAPPKNIIKSGGVLNGRAMQLPKPVYSQIARAAKATGIVTVQVLIDESGKVISAQAVSGHPLLRPAAVEAARRALFTPTYLSQQPVKVSGVITYNFTL
jgi:periplasmic protein TonB